jgi:SAM-dependent methyltransferase
MGEFKAMTMNWDDLKFKDDTFDAVVLFNSIHHSKNLTETLDSFHRVLKPGGMLIAVKEPIIPKWISYFGKKRLKVEHKHLETDGDVGELENIMTHEELVSHIKNSVFKNCFRVRPSQMTIDRLLFFPIHRLTFRYDKKLGARPLKWDEQLAVLTEHVKIVPFRVVSLFSKNIAEKLIFQVQKRVFAFWGITIILIKPPIAEE